ncbi:hypothetical protein SK128_016962, partial [Halocaridina rubra]
MDNMVRETRGEDLVHRNFFQGGISALPVVNVVAEGRSVRALIDKECSRSELAPWVCGAQGAVDSVKAVNGDTVCCVESSVVTVSVGGVAVVLDCVVTETLVDDIDAVLGVDLIEKLVGFEICKGKVRFLSDGIILAPVSNVFAVDDGTVIRLILWPILMKGSGLNGVGEKNCQPHLSTMVRCYKSALDTSTREAFNKELESWLSKEQGSTKHAGKYSFNGCYADQQGQ